MKKTKLSLSLSLQSDEMSPDNKYYVIYIASKRTIYIHLR